MISKMTRKYSCYAYIPMCVKVNNNMRKLIWSDYRDNHINIILQDMSELLIEYKML